MFFCRCFLIFFWILDEMRVTVFFGLLLVEGGGLAFALIGDFGVGVFLLEDAFG